MTKIVLHVIGSLDRGGAETFLMNVLRNINKDEIQFVFLCYGNESFDYEDEVVSLGAKIIRTTHPKYAGFIRHIKNIRRIINDENIDIVHVHTPYISMFSLIAAKQTGVVSRITHSHATKLGANSSLVKRVYILLSRATISLLSTDRVACEEEAGKALFSDKPFSVIHNGIVLDSFQFSKDSRNKIRRSYNIPDSATVIGHIGRMVPVKNQKFIIEVFEQYLKLVPDAYLLLVGEGDQKAENEQYAKKYKISERVKFLGSRGDVGVLYSAMDLFIFPSLHEGLGMVLIEAQANGLKSLASNTVPESVKLTSGVEFYPLTKGAKAWASKLGSMDLSRFDARKTLEQSPYNMAIGVKDIERLYIDSLERQ